MCLHLRYTSLHIHIYSNNKLKICLCHVHSFTQPVVCHSMPISYQQFWKDACQVQTYPENFSDTLCIQMDHSGTTADSPPGNSIIYDTGMLCFYYHMYSEMFEASRWHSDERFFAPMITHKNGDHIFVGDTVNFQDPAHGPCSGQVVKFMTEV